MKSVGARLKAGYETLRTTTDWLKNAGAADRLAGATPFLAMMSEVVGGMMLAKGALAAEGGAASSFDRTALAQFYAECTLSQIPAKQAEVESGADALARLY